MIGIASIMASQTTLSASAAPEPYLRSRPRRWLVLAWPAQ